MRTRNACTISVKLTRGHTATENGCACVVIVRAEIATRSCCGQDEPMLLPFRKSTSYGILSGVGGRRCWLWLANGWSHGLAQLVSCHPLWLMIQRHRRMKGGFGRPWDLMMISSGLLWDEERWESRGSNNESRWGLFCWVEGRPVGQ